MLQKDLRLKFHGMEYIYVYITLKHLADDFIQINLEVRYKESKEAKSGKVLSEEMFQFHQM